MASCIESLLPASNPTSYHLKLGDLNLLIRICYEVQSEFICDVIEEWLGASADSVNGFIQGILSSDFIWKSTSFSRFEMRIFTSLAFISEGLLMRIKQKLAACNVELTSLKNVLQFAVKISRTWEAMRLQELQAELNEYLNRCGAFLENLFKKDELSAEIWDIVPDFVSMAEDIDLGKWLGMICKRDLEDINPRGSQAVKNVLAKDSHAYHRSLPGWIARTFSRFTRRFAEDKELSEATLIALKDFGTPRSNAGLICRLTDCVSKRE